MSDNNHQINLRQIVKAVLFRLYLRNRYDAFWVPRYSARRQMRFFGVPEEKIIMGCYSIDGSLFHDGVPLPERPKRLLYVGQFVERKNVLRMCEAFLAIDKDVRLGWELEMCGCGPLKDKLPKDDAIVVHDFVQPERVSEMYRQARALVIPSYEDHWPLVMHEAVLSGCMVLTSERCGDREDFVLEGVNGFSFSPYKTCRMTAAMSKIMSMDDDSLIRGQRQSLALASQVTLETFVESVKKFT